jgi:N-acetylneuraminate synthase
MKLGALEVGGAAPCRVVAEIGQAHDGSLGTAHAYIDAVAAAGADAIKFQTHIADAESTPSEPFRVKFSKQDSTRYEYWKRMEFTKPQWAGLAEHAKDKGLVFMSSAFSMQAVELLEELHVPAWKVGAGEVTNLPMLRRMAKSGPVILSSGMSKWSELDAAVDAIRKVGSEVAVLQCTTAYPCPPEKLGLNVIAELRERYRCPVGLSDHSGVIYSGIAAAALGADLLEVHVVFSKECFGPDTPASITTQELHRLTEGVRFVKRALAPIDKEAMATELEDLRKLFTKSIVAIRDLPAGHRLTEADLSLKKPGTGLPANRLDDVIGRKLKRSIEKNAQILDEVLE